MKTFQNVWKLLNVEKKRFRSPGEIEKPKIALIWRYWSAWFSGLLFFKIDLFIYSSIKAP